MTSLRERWQSDPGQFEIVVPPPKGKAKPAPVQEAARGPRSEDDHFYGAWSGRGHGTAGAVQHAPTAAPTAATPISNVPTPMSKDSPLLQALEAEPTLGPQIGKQGLKGDEGGAATEAGRRLGYGAKATVVPDIAPYVKDGAMPLRRAASHVPQLVGGKYRVFDGAFGSGIYAFRADDPSKGWTRYRNPGTTDLLMALQKDAKVYHMVEGPGERTLTEWFSGQLAAWGYPRMARWTKNDIGFAAMLNGYDAVIVHSMGTAGAVREVVVLNRGKLLVQDPSVAINEARRPTDDEDHYYGAWHGPRAGITPGTLGKPQAQKPKQEPQRDGRAVFAQMMTQWPQSKPWDATQADVEAGKVPGVVMDPELSSQRGSNGAGNIVAHAMWSEPYIKVGNLFFDSSTPQIRLWLLYHEAGHKATGAVDWDSLSPIMDKYKVGDGQWKLPWWRGIYSDITSGNLLSEMLADTWANYMVYGSENMSDAERQLSEVLVQAGKQYGFPTKPQLRAIHSGPMDNRQTTYVPA